MVLVLMGVIVGVGEVIMGELVLVGKIFISYWFYWGRLNVFNY